MNNKQIKSDDFAAMMADNEILTIISYNLYHEYKAAGFKPRNISEEIYRECRFSTLLYLCCMNRVVPTLEHVAFLKDLNDEIKKARQHQLNNVAVFAMECKHYRTIERGLMQNNLDDLMPGTQIGGYVCSSCTDKMRPSESNMITKEFINIENPIAARRMAFDYLEELKAHHIIKGDTNVLYTINAIEGERDIIPDFLIYASDDSPYKRLIDLDREAVIYKVNNYDTGGDIHIIDAPTHGKSKYKMLNDSYQAFKEYLPVPTISGMTKLYS